MFPNQNYNDWSFQASDYISEEQNQVDDQNIEWIDPSAVQNMNTNVSLPADQGTRGRNRGRGRGRGRGRSRRSSASADDAVNVGGDNDDEEMRKTIHREVERQRRQEMSNLYSSLRNILPADYIKGKRSTSDHVAETVNYIKDLEKNVKELADKRDRLSATAEWSNPIYQEAGGSSSNPCRGSVVINPCLGGINIEINVGYEDENFSLSSALQIIFEEGLSVASSTSNKFNERIIHNIVCEVNDMSCIDFYRLQQRLINLVS